MALQLAALLEDVASREDWQQMHLSSMNEALATYKVSAGYSVLVTIAGRSYSFSSDKSGKVTVSMPGPGRQTMKALSQAQVRVVLDYDAFKDYDSTASGWADDMVLKRKIRFEGDTEHLEQFETDVGGNISAVKSKVQSGGPGIAAINEARAQLEEAMNDLKGQAKETFEMELSNATETTALALPEAAYDYDSQPELCQVFGWLLFSALSSFNGNMGQGNYCAANAFMDAQSFNARITKRLNDYPVTMMWGAVTGIGMRWKAFASQDFLEKDETLKAMTFDYTLAMKGVGYILRGFAPEWVSVGLMDPGTIEFIKMNIPFRFPDPWGFSKGKGGGVSFHDADVSEDVRSSKQVAIDEQFLSAGRRVELFGLVLNPEMNGVRGTLIEEVDDNKWSVRLDGDMGDKIIKVQNIKGFATTRRISTDDHSTKEFCVAGTWSDWMPRDMHWDTEGQCHILDVQIESLPARFDVARGRAGEKQWKKRVQKWDIRQKGMIRIKVFCKDMGILDRVVSERLSEEVVPAVPEEKVDVPALRDVLHIARPDWTDKELWSVEEKLEKVNISTASELLTSVTEKKKGLNERLKAIGEKTFSGETLKAFREYAKSSA